MPETAILGRLPLNPGSLTAPWSGLATRFRVPKIAEDASAIPRRRSVRLTIQLPDDVHPPAWVVPTIDQLNERAPQASDAALLAALKFLGDHARANTAPPFLSALAGGGIQLEWSQGGLDIELYVSADGLPLLYVNDLQTGVEQEGPLTEVADFLEARIHRLNQAVPAG
jgi:hypothetical protein